MGTIGHHTLLYVLKGWQVRAAIRGYYRRERPIYEAARMLGLWAVSCQRTQESPTLELSDLIQFPWDPEKKVEMLSEDEIAELQQMMREENARLKESRTK